MKKTPIYFLIFIGTVTLVKPESCYFDFEQSDELKNFDSICNGEVGAWSIVNTPKLPSLNFETGESALTSDIGKTACISTAKAIELPLNVKFTADFFIQISSESHSSEVSFELRPLETSEPISKIDVFKSGLPVNGDGEWIRKSLEFTNNAGDYKIVINMYHNGNAIVLLDKVLIENLPSNDCYVVPKPTTSTESTTITTEPTTSTESTTITTEPTTSTESTTITTESTTVTKEPTTSTESTTITTEPTTSTESTTITTEPTTSRESTTLTTESTTSTESNTLTTTTELTTITTEPTILTESTTINTKPTAVTTETSKITVQPTTIYTTPPIEFSTTTKIPNSYPGFSFFYIVIIIAASGAFILISVSATFIILRKGKLKRKYTRRQKETYMHRNYL